MTTTWKKFILTGLLVASISTMVFCQPITAKYELGVNAGLFIYQGDLTPDRAGSFKTARFGFDLFYSRLMSPSFALRTNLGIAGLKGDDSRYINPEFRKQRNFAFKTPLAEISELIVYDPLGKNYDDHGLRPYLMAGVGVSFLHIKRDWSRFNSEYFGNAPEVLSGLNEDQNHALPSTIPVLPVGLGLRYSISHSLAITAEASYRFTFTDYIDGFSQAANPGKNDHYTSYVVGIVFKPGWRNKLSCPTVLR